MIVLLLGRVIGVRVLTDGFNGERRGRGAGRATCRPTPDRRGSCGGFGAAVAVRMGAGCAVARIDSADLDGDHMRP